MTLFLSEVLNPPKGGAKGVSGFAADVYSFGVVVWEIATGENPYNGKSFNEIIIMVGVEKQHLPIPDEVNPFLANIMVRCWQTDPESRITFQELDHELSKNLTTS